MHMHMHTGTAGRGRMARACTCACVRGHVHVHGHLGDVELRPVDGEALRARELDEAERAAQPGVVRAVDLRRREAHQRQRQDAALGGRVHTVVPLEPVEFVARRPVEAEALGLGLELEFVGADDLGAKVGPLVQL